MSASFEIKNLFKGKFLYFTLIVLILNGLNIILVSKNIYYLSLLPVILLVVYFLFFKPDILFFIIAAVTPMSINYLDEQSGFSLFLPTEPLLVLLMFAFFIKIFISKDYDKKILRHPVSIIIMVNTLWILVTAISSTMPLVSFKFFLVRLWYVTVFYFMAIQIFKEPGKIKTFVWLYSGMFVIVVIYTLYNHSLFYFSQHTANLAPRPFFKDHTVYGATLALFIPVVYGFAFMPKALGIKKYAKLFTLIVAVVLTTGVVFSYTRAAWVSLIAATLLLIAMLFRIKFRTLSITLILMVVLLLVFWPKIILMVGQNNKISSTDFKDHVESISNISTDPSNSERINRWKCAVRMFKEKPLVGWGPGTYMFQYAPFQRSYERTIISTNLGILGNAHSEYLGPLAESGIMGMLTFLALVIVVLYKGVNLYYEGNSRQIRILSLLCLLSLVTYFAHGLMNNFLDTDKASVPFWSYIAVLTAFDLYHKKSDSGLEIKE